MFSSPGYPVSRSEEEIKAAMTIYQQELSRLASGKSTNNVRLPAGYPEFTWHRPELSNYHKEDVKEEATEGDNKQGLSAFMRSRLETGKNVFIKKYSKKE